MEEKRLKELRDKVDFVDGLSAVIAKYCGNVNSITYEVYEDVSNPEWLTEVLVYHFVGGAILVRDCSGNSQSAILEEVANYVNGGYYAEVERYEKRLLNPKYFRRVL